MSRAGRKRDRDRKGRGMQTVPRSSGPEMEVDNPYWAPGAPAHVPRQVKVARSLRDDLLGRMHAQGGITDAEYYGGRDWQGHYEASQIGSVGSIDPLQEAVDGGPRVRDPITDRQRAASLMIAYVDRRLLAHMGDDGKRLVRDVLAGGRSLRDIVAARGEGGYLAERYWSRRAKIMLGIVAKALGFGG